MPFSEYFWVHSHFIPSTYHSVMKKYINPVILFRKKIRARITHTFLKIKFQCVVVKLAALPEYF